MVPFIPGPDASRDRLATRITRIASETGATDCEADLLSAEQGRALLARFARLPLEQLPHEATEIIAECEWLLPKGLREIGSAVRQAPGTLGGHPEKAEVPKVLAPTAASVDEIGKENPAAKEHPSQAQNGWNGVDRNLTFRL